MRILSQDGKIDVPYEQCVIKTFFNELFTGTHCVSAYICGVKECIMAEYSTEEKYEVQRKYGKTYHCKLEPTNMDVTHVKGRSLFCPLAGKWED